jgi:hypothetical protein
MAVTSEPPEIPQLCAELRTVLSRHDVELTVSPTTEDTIRLGPCCPPTARRLLQLLRQVPPPRDLRAAVREANALSLWNRMIKEERP